MCPDLEPTQTYFERQNKTAEDFTFNMQMQSHNFDIAKESLVAKILVLFSQGIITEATFQTLCQSVTDMKHYFTAAESNYYEMRNMVDEYEKKNKK